MTGVPTCRLLSCEGEKRAVMSAPQFFRLLCSPHAAVRLNDFIKLKGLADLDVQCASVEGKIVLING